MKLFHISQTVNRGYDTYSDAVVCAKDADEAQQMHPLKRAQGLAYDDYIRDPADHSFDWDLSWTAPCNVTVKYLGEADDSVPHGMVCTSYHAG